MDFMDKIEFLRERNGISQKKLAEILDINSSSYSNYKRYDRILPVKHLNTLSNLFDVSIDYLLGLTDIKNYNYPKEDVNIKKSSSRIIVFRKDYKITQSDLASFLNTTQSTISAYEHAETLITTPFLYDICKNYNISADYLLGKIDFNPMKKDININ